MTKEERIIALKVIKKYSCVWEYDETEERAIDAIIEMLEQEPCEDCISRAEVLDNYNGVETPVGYRKVVDIEVIKNMKSVQPKPKTYGDCISRAEAIKTLKELEQEDIETYGCKIPEGFDADEAIEKLRNLPSVQPKQKPIILKANEKQFEELKEAIRNNPLCAVMAESKTDVLDKIRAEIKEESRFCPLTEGLERALEIIDKYRGEK